MKMYIGGFGAGAYVMRLVSLFDGSSEIEQTRWWLASVVFLAAWMVVHAFEKRAD